MILQVTFSNNILLFMKTVQFSYSAKRILIYQQQAIILHSICKVVNNVQTFNVLNNFFINISPKLSKMHSYFPYILLLHNHYLSNFDAQIVT